jgi:hypothetical protein
VDDGKSLIGTTSDIGMESEWDGSMVGGDVGAVSERGSDSALSIVNDEEPARLGCDADRVGEPAK